MVERNWSLDIRDIGDRIASLPVSHATELSRYLAEVHGVEAVATPVVRSEEQKDNKTSIEPVNPNRTVLLEGYDPARKIHVIKTVRELTKLGLKEARDLVEGPPRAIGEDLPPEEANRLKTVLEEAGAKVSLK